MAAKSNPNGANQFMLDPRQKLCWESYANPKSETFGNAKQSAIRAGYEEVYADTITASEWFTGKVRRLNLLHKAEKVLDEMLEMPVTVLKFNKKGDVKEEGEEDEKSVEEESGENPAAVFITTDPALVKIKQDTAKFVAERQGKNDGYSTRSEVTGKDGEKLGVSEETQALANEALLKYLNGGKQDK